MVYSKKQMTVVGCGVAAILLLVPAASEGGLFDCLCPWSSGCGATSSATTYAPPYVTQRVSLMPVAPATACSPVSQTCYLTPKSTHRWSFSRMSVTRYRPVTTVDPCTGSASTVIQPVTRKTLLPWLHRKPVTTYGLTCTNGSAPTCTTACYPTYGNTWASSCSTGACSPLCQPNGILRTIYTAPLSGCPTGCAPITTGAGASAGATSTADPGYGNVPSTFKSERAGESNDTSDPTAPIPDANLQDGPALNGNSASTERRERSRWTERENKTAQRPFRHASFVAPIEKPVSHAVSSPPRLDVGGWRAARD